MHPSIHAKTHPDRAAIIMASTGKAISFAELDRNSNRVAQLVRSRNIEIGDTVAICMENNEHFFDLVWGAQRCGLIYVAISNRLTADEIAYILKDSGAQLLFSSSTMAPVLKDIKKLTPEIDQLIFGGEGAENLDAALAKMPDTPVADERAGADMLYSSGTTGRPKGVRLPLPEVPELGATNALLGLATMAFGFSEGDTYISPAPLYHAAPLRWCMLVHKIAGTVIVMEKFDPEHALQLIERYKVNISQWVPTHFVRMLKLPEEVRMKYDVSSLTSAVHAAAPCPVPVKEQMIKWWGPVLKEYYAGTEGNGLTFINSENWLTHKGSVGQALMGVIKICDENGDEVLANTEGQIYFEGGSSFEYHNDPDKTAESANKHGWTSLGDVGKVDEDGFLYLTDRKSFMIITGGVNVYPQEIENLLVTHPKLADAAVIGGPDPDMGEKVIAIVQPLDMADATDDFAVELENWMRQTLSGVKVPRQIDFREELPRHATGKLYKRLLRDEYWAAEKSKI